MHRSSFVVHFSCFSFIVVGIALAGCGSSSSGGPGAGPSDGGVAQDGGAPDPLDAGPLVAPAGGLALRVNQASTVKTRSGDAGAWSSTIVFMNVTIANGSGAPDVPANVALFAVKTSTGLVKAAEPDAEYEVGDGYRSVSAMYLPAATCDASIAIAGGAQITCNLAVAFDGDAIATEVKLLTPGAMALANGVASPGADTRTATASLAPAACTPCGGDLCTDVALDRMNCGACGVILVDNGDAAAIRCAQGKAACADPTTTPCPYSEGFMCVDLATDTSNCGACGVDVASGGTCVGGHATCTSAGTTLCAKGCLDLTRDDANCGACDHACPIDSFCSSGACKARTAVTGYPNDCLDFCNGLSKTCVDDNLVKYFTSSSSAPCSTGIIDCITTLPRDGYCAGNYASAGVECACR